MASRYWTPPAALPDGTQVRIEVEPVASEFWAQKSVEDLAKEPQVEPICDLQKLAIPWPQEESVDDLMALVREVRR